MLQAGEVDMSVARVTEIIASSPESFEDATRKGLKRASKTLKNVRGAWVEGQKVSCDASGHVTEFRVILKVTFVLED
jgi:flavin-binding protein dodecin